MKEQRRQKKNEEKRQRKLNKGNIMPDGTIGVPPAAAPEAPAAAAPVVVPPADPTKTVS
jgi:hypothetical protein